LEESNILLEIADDAISKLKDQKEKILQI